MKREPAWAQNYSGFLQSLARIVANPGQDLVRHDGKQRFWCEVCPLSFRTLPGIREHMKVEHRSEYLSSTQLQYPFRCDRCPRKFGNVNSLRAHKRSHGHDGEGEEEEEGGVALSLVQPPPGAAADEESCRQWEQLVSPECLLVENGSAESESEVGYGCDACGTTFEQEAGLQEHFAAAHDTTHACRVCRKVFALAKTLIRHQQVHTGQKQFECTACYKTFQHDKNLTLHQRVHTGDKAFVCDVCARRFARKSALEVHKRTHTGERPFECDVCHKRFINTSNLNEHRRTHTGERPWECHLCGKTFSFQSHYGRHMLYIHGGKARPAALESFKCGACDKVFTRKGHLARHERTHTAPAAPATDVGAAHTEPGRVPDG